MHSSNVTTMVHPRESVPPAVETRALRAALAVLAAALLAALCAAYFSAGAGMDLEPDMAAQITD